MEPMLPGYNPWGPYINVGWEGSICLLQQKHSVISPLHFCPGLLLPPHQVPFQLLLLPKHLFQLSLQCYRCFGNKSSWKGTWCGGRQIEPSQPTLIYGPHGFHVGMGWKWAIYVGPMCFSQCGSHIGLHIWDLHGIYVGKMISHLKYIFTPLTLYDSCKISLKRLKKAYPK